MLDFADGDNVNVTVVVTDSDNNEKFVQTATLTVSGKAEIAKTSLFTYTGFNGSREESDDGHVFSKDDVKNITAKDTIKKLLTSLRSLTVSSWDQALFIPGTRHCVVPK